MEIALISLNKLYVPVLEGQSSQTASRKGDGQLTASTFPASAACQRGPTR
eukprot:COSAG02_NODE_70698_length_194_cov_47.831579_1_plen_49_part_01